MVKRPIIVTASIRDVMSFLLKTLNIELKGTVLKEDYDCRGRLFIIKFLFWEMTVKTSFSTLRKAEILFTGAGGGEFTATAVRGPMWFELVTA
jgi:hypothetical protein